MTSAVPVGHGDHEGVVGVVAGGLAQRRGRAVVDLGLDAVGALEVARAVVEADPGRVAQVVVVRVHEVEELGCRLGLVDRPAESRGQSGSRCSRPMGRAGPRWRLGRPGRSSRRPVRRAGSRPRAAGSGRPAGTRRWRRRGPRTRGRCRRQGGRRPSTTGRRRSPRRPCRPGRRRWALPDSCRRRARSPRARG